MAEPTTLAGPARAAVLLLSLGEESAAQVLKHLGPKQVQSLGEAMTQVQAIPKSQINGIVEQFLSSLGDASALGIDSQAYVKRVLVQALGKEKASGLIDRIVSGADAGGLENLKWMDAKAVAGLVRDEHPQVVAIVLSSLEPDHAAQVLALLPESARADILMRVSHLDAIQPAAMAELNLLLEKQVQGTSGLSGARVGGVKIAADILNFVDTSIEGEIMESIKGLDAELGQEIQDLMFVFENLFEVDDSAVQALLREVSSENLLIALKGADERMREKFFSNMSKRAAEMLRDDLEAKGPVRLSEVEEAQKEIIGIAQRMAEEGTIILGGQGGDEFV